jgi:hypothetical protein
MDCGSGNRMRADCRRRNAGGLAQYCRRTITVNNAPETATGIDGDIL